jgi:micrococcal nuclease
MAFKIKLIVICLGIIATALLPSCSSTSQVTVNSVIDGDTIHVNGTLRVRYLGIDTPEIGEPYYQQVKEENSRLLSGKIITLETDLTNEDFHGRLLRYVRADKIFVNLELVRLGYAFVYSRTKFPDNKYYDLFKSALDEAVLKSKGIWSLKNHPKMKYRDDYYLPVSFFGK